MITTRAHARQRQLGANPFMGNFRTSDGGTINLCMRQPDRTSATRSSISACPKLADDPRFADVRS